MTGPELLAAIQREIKEMSPGDTIEINQSDLRALGKLKASDLSDVPHALAERITNDLRDGNTASLGELLGMKIRVDPNATAMN